MAFSGMEAPFNNPEWETWGLGNDPKVHQVDRVFEIHPLEVLAESHHDRAKRQWAECPNVVTPENFPRSEIEKFWPYGLDSSAAYMLVLAMHENMDTKPKIGIWGFHMATDAEYKHQRENMIALIFFARALGFDVWIHPASSLNLKKRYYPYPLEDFGPNRADVPVRVGKMRAGRL